MVQLSLPCPKTSLTLFSASMRLQASHKHGIAAWHKHGIMACCRMTEDLSRALAEGLLSRAGGSTDRHQPFDDARPRSVALCKCKILCFKKEAERTFEVLERRGPFSSGDPAAAHQRQEHAVVAHGAADAGSSEAREGVFCPTRPL